MPARGQPLLVGGRFALESEHKRGGMGTVWRGRDLSTERPVAVKILHKEAVEAEPEPQRRRRGRRK